MTEMECVLRPNAILELKNALGKLGIKGVTVTEAMGFVLQKGHEGENWNMELNINLLPKTKIELVVSDHRVDQVIKVIIKTARAGEIGDGKIFTYPIGTAIRLRTGETGESAI